MDVPNIVVDIPSDQEPDGDREKNPPETKFFLGRDDYTAALAPTPRFPSKTSLFEEDSSPKLFCELQELCPKTEAGDMEWREMARWVKFEEDVEEGGKKWSKPHVASLSLHALFEVKHDLKDAIFIFDVSVTSLVELVDLLLREMERREHVARETRLRVGEVLLSRHHHLHEHQRHLHVPHLLRRQSSDTAALRNARHKSGSACDLRSSGDLSKRRISLGRYRSAEDVRRGSESSPGDLGKFPDGPSRLTRQLSVMDQASDHRLKHNLSFMKRLPKGAHAANILVGTVDFLQHPLVVFIRLGPATALADLTEVPLESKFVFLLLGPGTSPKRYHEAGRCMATLLSDDHFRSCALEAQQPDDIQEGVNTFLNELVVLPPGEWDPKIRIEPPNKLPKRVSSFHSKLAGEGDASQAWNGDVIGDVIVDEEEKCDPALIRTGRCFGGLVADIRRKWPWYWSDFRDALHLQCVASVIFIYIAALTPIVTFGGLLGVATHNYMAAMEGIMAGAMTGVTFALFAGQPLNIIGSTGPMLVFEAILFKFCDEQGLYFLGFRFWIGMWAMLFLLLIVAFDLSSLVRYITRFTEESFAGLISLIFIYEAIEKLLEVEHVYGVNTYPRDPSTGHCACTQADNASAPGNSSSAAVNASTWTGLSQAELRLQCFAEPGWELEGHGCHYVPDVFLFSVLIFLGTFFIAYMFKVFRNSPFFPAKVREVVSDFNVVLAVILMVLTDWAVGLETPKLNVPSEFKPTRGDRGWVVEPFGGNPWWTALAGCLPAALVTILIFMDQQITAVIVNRHENKFQKGVGYHLDLFVVTLQIGACSVLGLPWFVASTVIAVSHVMSLRKESESAAPGEKPQFLGVRENRLTNLLVGILTGLSIYLTVVFKYIPMPVLYGVFLYMGISSLNGLQLIDRLLLVPMPAKYQPDYIYLRHVQTYRVHIFTAIQVTCLGVLWAVKAIKLISIAFPLMILLICFVRKGLECIFSKRELAELDDPLPEQHKRDKHKSKTAKHASARKALNLAVGLLHIPLKGGNVMTVPADKVIYTAEADDNMDKPAGMTDAEDSLHGQVENTVAR